MNNFYLIDKDLNFSSFDIIRILKKQLNIKRIGHTWTLDPLATGGLLIATWNYTKLIPYLEKDKKTYEFVINLDGTTDSFDLAEEVNFLDKKLQKKFKEELTKEKINSILQEKFLWKIIQIPPKYSAIKINWKRAYSLARAWKDVKMKSREVEIFSIKILDFSYPKLKLEAEVSAWTYIRSIAMDLWNIIWTWWYISFLRRTKIWQLDLKNAQKIDSFDKNKYLNIEELFDKKRFIKLDNDILQKINNWLKIKQEFDFETETGLFVLQNNKITNIVKYDWKILKPVRKI